MFNPDMPPTLMPVKVNDNAKTVLAKRYFRKDGEGNPLEDATAMFWRVACPRLRWRNWPANSST